jgi:hypothetical protein
LDEAEVKKGEVQADVGYAMMVYEQYRELFKTKIEIKEGAQ